MRLEDKVIQVKQRRTAWATLSPQRTLGSAIEWLGANQVALVSSFGTDSAVLLHMMSEINPSNPVIFLDTEFHFDETLRYLEDLVDRLGLTGIQRARIDPVSRKRLDPDQQLHRRDPDRCCQARKVEVLDRALKGFQGWISGQKRFQSSLRNDVEVLEVDVERNLIKINPLAYWSEQDIEEYLADHDLPRHPLASQGFASVGCWPCTSPLQAGESGRAGRWRGQDKQECGLHETQPLRLRNIL